MAEDRDARAALIDRLSELRRRHDSLDAVREMVDLHRRLAADVPEDAEGSEDPDDDAGQLAAALLLALRRAGAGQHGDALAAAARTGPDHRYPQPALGAPFGACAGT